MTCPVKSPRKLVEVALPLDTCDAAQQRLRSQFKLAEYCLTTQ